MNKNNCENVVGKDIGIYRILYECNYKSKCHHKMYHVKCNQCGWESDMELSDIKRPKECKHLDMFGNYIDKKFRWKNQRLGSIFKHMKQRCYVPSNKDYPNWGGKGIKICQKWLDNPRSFEDWSLSHGYTDELTIDRIDEDRDYCPENCHWVTGSYNAKYKSTTNEIEVDGTSHTGREWPEFLNLGTNTINSMLRKYDEELVKEFIRRRLVNPNLTRKPNQLWMNVYGLI